MTDSEDSEFRELCREYLELSIEERIRRGFRLEDRPVRDDVSRAFNTMAEYRAWCEANLPDHLGFKRPSNFAELRDRDLDLDSEDASKIMQRLSPR